MYPDLSGGEGSWVGYSPGVSALQDALHFGTIALVEWEVGDGEDSLSLIIRVRLTLCHGDAMSLLAVLVVSSQGWVGVGFSLCNGLCNSTMGLVASLSVFAFVVVVVNVLAVAFEVGCGHWERNKENDSHLCVHRHYHDPLLRTCSPPVLLIGGPCCRCHVATWALM